MGMVSRLKLDPEMELGVCPFEWVLLLEAREIVVDVTEDTS